MLIVFALGGLGWWWWQRRQPKPVEDEWVLPPPEETPNLTRRTTEGADLTPDAQAGGLPGAPGGFGAGGAPGASGLPGATGVSGSAFGSTTAAGTPRASDRPPILDREALLHRDRTFDPRNWDNTPDAPGARAEEVEGDFPKFFDREYLEKRERERRGDEG